MITAHPTDAHVRPVGLNLLAFGSIRGLVRWPGFPYVFQLLALAVLLSLAMLGWGQMPPKGVPDKLYAKANLVNLVVWGLFWPAIVWATVLLGRVWCTVCPLELISNLFERAGRRLDIAQGSLPGWIEGVWTIGLFPVLLWAMIAGLLLLFKGASSFGEALRRIALPLAIVIAHGQMAKGLAKLVSWAGFLTVAWSQPNGVSTSLAMAARAMKQPAALISLRTVSIAGIALVLTAFWFSLRELRYSNGSVRCVWRLPVVAVTGIFGFVIYGWGFLQ